MAVWKQGVVGTVTLVALVGVFVALANLPVLTGCGYYATCGSDIRAQFSSIEQDVRWTELSDNLN